MRRPTLVPQLLAAAAALAVTGCTPWGRSAPGPSPVVVRSDTIPPALPAESMVQERSPDAPRLVEVIPERLVSLNAVNADVRPLLISIAREAGIDLVVTSDVNRRVSINLKDVPASEAIAAIALAADLTLGVPKQRDLPAVVFYQLPVNVNQATAETIAARFGVSLDLARFIVENKP